MRVENKTSGGRITEPFGLLTAEGAGVSFFADIVGYKRPDEDLKDKANLVRLLCRTTGDTNQAESLKDAMRNALAEICTYNGWPIGHAYVCATDNPDMLISSGIWHLDDSKRFATFREATEKTTFKSGVDLPGRVLVGREPAWIVDVTKDPNFMRAKLAKEIAIKASFACPVLVRSEVVAVLEFFASEAVEPDQTLLDILIQIGIQLGRVAERERAEEELRESQALMVSSIQNLQEGFAIYDPDDRLVTCNDVYREMFPAMADKLEPGASYTELLDLLIERGQYVLKDIEPDQWRRIRLKAHRDGDGTPLLRQTLEGRWIISRERRTADGYIVGVRIDITEIKRAEEALRESEERLKFQLATLTDREEQLKARATELVAIAKDLALTRDELQKLNDEKDKFFSIIAHDLRSPFNVLLGYSSFLSDGIEHLDKAKVMESVLIMNDAVQRACKLLENLLEWSRLQMGRMEFQPVSLDLRGVTDTNVTLFTPIAEEKGVRLTSKRKKALNAFADAHMVDTIVRNLVSNAIKFTPKGGVITLKARRDGNWVEVKVADTGIGMSADKVARLFRLDQKTSTAGTDGETGTGLGLHLCKEMVDKHGGRIFVESAVNEGSTFCFTLPVAPDQTPP